MKNNFGVTLVELLVVIGILGILMMMVVPGFQFFRRGEDLNKNSEEIINTLRLAQNKTLASEGASQWGVYFNTSTSPHQYVLFKGSDYDSRATSSDETHQLPKRVEVYEINLGGKKEVVFSRITGKTDQSGSVSLRLETDFTETRTVYIESSGQVSLTSPSVPTNSRVKDSRHVHLDYSRLISTSTEKLILTFDTTVIKEIIISDFLKEEQIYWEGEVNVNGDIQELKIHTHRLNDPVEGSQFCVHRDRRYNNKALIIDIDDTPTDPDPGTLISYTSQGDTAKGSSVYVSNLQWQ